jgi:hypothetical protein
MNYIRREALISEVQAAIDAVTWWRYWVTGEPVEVDTTIQVVFPPVNN